MVIRKKIELEEVDAILNVQDITEEIKRAGDNVAVVLTQSWCPQWSYMNNYLLIMEKTYQEKDIHLFTLVYDLIPRYTDFLRFKEEVFGNYQIPYVRYYRGGNFVGESNVVGQEGFLFFFKS